jgi:CheY-like chemotaxis protein
MATALLIDDNEDIHRFVRYYLERAGHALLSASSGASGRALALAGRADVILLDVVLPDADGFVLCRELRGHSRTGLTPIILLTVKDSTANKIKGFEAGCDEYVAKPFHPGELLARIESVLRARAARLTEAERQQERARADAARQTFGALSHHIGNAIQVIMSAADGYRPETEEGQAFREAALAQAWRIKRVLESLGEMVTQMKLKVTQYPGTREGILDIAEETLSRAAQAAAAAV